MDDPDESYVVEQETPDRCGRNVRGHPPLLRLATIQGVFWVPYHGIAGVEEKDDHFVIHVRATLGWEGRSLEGYWKAAVNGLRLRPILDYLGSGQRAEIHPGGTISAQEPYVNSIVLTPVETDVFQNP